MAAQPDKHDQTIHRPQQVPPERIAPTEPAQDARQAKKLGVMRYVLGASFLLAVVALFLVWLFVLAPRP